MGVAREGNEVIIILTDSDEGGVSIDVKSRTPIDYARTPAEKMGLVLGFVLKCGPDTYKQILELLELEMGEVKGNA